MDKLHTNIPTDDSGLSAPLSSDDMDMLQQVLKSVKGAYPAEPYRQADYAEDYSA